jgi:hypothetical protein
VGARENQAAAEIEVEAMEERSEAQEGAAPLNFNSSAARFVSEFTRIAASGKITKRRAKATAGVRRFDNTLLTLGTFASEKGQLLLGHLKKVRDQ